MPYLNDTMRVEMSLPVHMMLAVLTSGVRKKDQEYHQTRQHLLEASAEPIRDLYPHSKMHSVVRRIERLHREVVAPYMKDNEADPRKIGIMAYYLIQHLVDTELLIIPPESSFGKALDVMLPALSPWEGSTPEEVADFDRIDRSARKQIRKMLQALQAEGYYREIPLPDFQAEAA